MNKEGCLQNHCISPTIKRTALDGSLLTGSSRRFALDDSLSTALKSDIWNEGGGKTDHLSMISIPNTRGLSFSVLEKNNSSMIAHQI